LCNAAAGKANKQQHRDELIDYKALAMGTCEVASVQDEFN
jgi:hypothetical protein